MVRSPTTLRDLTRHLIWPNFLEVPRLALSPAALLPGIAAAGAMLLLDAAYPHALGMPEAWTGIVSKPLSMLSAQGGEAWLAVKSGSIVGVLDAAVTASVRVPRDLLFEYWPSLLALFLVLAVLAWSMTAAARVAVVRLGRRERVGIAHALRFASRRIISVLAAWCLPLVAIWAGAIGLSVVGWMLRTGGLNVLTAVLLPVPLILSLAIVLIGLIGGLGATFAPGAAAADDADGFDIVQRGYSYVLARPLRLFIYLAILAAVCWLSISIFGAILEATSRLWLVAADVRLADKFPLTTEDGSIGQSGKLVRMWWTLGGCITIGYIISILGASTGALYLAMRRLVDGQQEREVWVDGLIPGTQVASIVPFKANTGSPIPLTAASTVREAVNSQIDPVLTDPVSGSVSGSDS